MDNDDEIGRQQAGDRNPPDNLHPGRAVHLGRLDHLLVNRADGGQVHDSGPSGVLPGQPQPHPEPHMFLGAQESDRFVNHPEIHQDRVDRAGGAQHVESNREHKHPADEVRQCRNSLDEFLVRTAFYFVEKHRENHREPAEGQGDSAHGEGIQQHAAHICQPGRIGNNVFEPFQADKCFRGNRLRRHIVVERVNPAVQRVVGNQCDKNQQWQDVEKFHIRSGLFAHLLTPFFTLSGGLFDSFFQSDRIYL